MAELERPIIQLADASGPQPLSDESNYKFLQQIFDAKEREPLAKKGYDVDAVFQILEGEKKVVLDLFDVIKKDKRHSNVFVLGEDKKSERIFSDWHMAFHKFDNRSEDEKYFRDNIVAFSELTAKPTHVIDLFWTMAKHMAIN